MILERNLNILLQSGEWGIKLKSRKDNLTKKFFTKFLIKMCIWTIAFPIVFLIFGYIVDRLNFQWLYDYSPKIYHNAINLFDSIFTGHNIIIFGLIIWFVGFIVMLYKLIKTIFYYVSLILNASENLLNKDIEYIELPSGFEDLQKKMNHLKRESEKNERLARESEQKKNDLIVYLAHDLKTPLTSMIGYLSLLDEIKDMSKKQREKYISIALNKSYRLEDLINELFDIARFNSETIVLEKEEVNLTLMLEQIIDDFYPILTENNKEIKLNYNDKILINGDSDKLARVFSNLIKNAISYSSDNLITIDVETFNDFVTITTSNKGKKISEEKLNKIFEKFYRLDSSRTSKTGGSGIGLSIAKEIVELHGGNIKATSDDNFTKFIVNLPIKNNK